MSILADILYRPLIKRDVLPQIIKWIAKKEAVVLIGSRQVGKTCLLYLLIQHLVKAMKIPKEDIFYFDLERIENLEMLNAG
ncbi:MAG: AAA family ATPase, partial [Candidatus Omnitrophica bacterium]|nr:AAA family ATPase [Candidatus Omnitrophota bacterium]